MQENRGLQFVNIHSEEVQEVITQPPGWLLRRGNWIIACVFIGVVVGSWAIYYPDIVPATFTLVSADSPRKVLARRTGRIQKLFVKNGDRVNIGAVLLYSESTAEYEEILKLDSILREISLKIADGGWKHLKTHLLPRLVGLGELQDKFQTFCQQYDLLMEVLEDGYIIRKRMLLLEDLDNQKKMEGTLIEQLELQRRDFELAQEDFKIKERLFNSKTIPLLEYSQEKAKLLNREMPLKTLTSSLIQNRTSQTAKRKELLELENVVVQQKNSIALALHSLQNDIENWKQTFILAAPVTGKISFSEPWQEQQTVSIDQNVMTVEPDDGRFLGVVKLTQTNFGKIREGQEVLIKLDGYPFQEYGIIRAQLAHISPTTGSDNQYWGYVTLPDMPVLRGHEIKFRNGMTGHAEIITENKRLIERLLVSMKMRLN